MGLRDSLAVLENKKSSYPLLGFENRISYMDHKTYLASETHRVLFVSPSGISEINCATTKTDTAERSISIARESLQVFVCTRGLGVLPGSTARG